MRLTIAARNPMIRIIALWVMLITFLQLDLSVSAQSETEILAQLFDDSCTNPCYLGIEPGVTTWVELENDLQSQNIEYFYELGVVQWAAVTRTGVLKSGDSRGVMVTILDDIVIQVVSPIDTTVEAVIEVFGTPNIVAESGTRQYSMAYPSLGLTFILNPLRDPNRITTIVNSRPNDPASRTSNPSGENITQSCPTYGQPPCIAPTATPTQIPLPTAVPTATLTPSLTPTVTRTPTRTPTATPSFKAEAGPNQTVKIPHDGLIGGDPLYASVTLNGAGSIGAVAYAWSRNGQPVSGQAVTTLMLIPGSYLFTLTITGAGGQTDSDSLTVTVTTCITGTAGCGDTE